MKALRLMYGVLACWLYILSQVAMAASQHVLWGSAVQQVNVLKKFDIKTSNLASLSPYTLVYQNTNARKRAQRHTRFRQYFHDLPVMGAELIYHQVLGKPTTVTGLLYTGIEQDILSFEPMLSSQDAIDRVMKTDASLQSLLRVETIIYIDESSNRAHLVYALVFRSHQPTGVRLIHVLIDAEDGQIYRRWDALAHSASAQGQGLGGYQFNTLSYRSTGAYQYGDSQMGWPYVLSPFLIQTNHNSCKMQSDLFQVYSLHNKTEEALLQEGIALPISSALLLQKNITPFEYACGPGYINLNDAGEAPINGAYSPLNDANYFAHQVYQMFESFYGLHNPVGRDLPIAVFTHLDDYENAFACGSQCMKDSGLQGPQQLVLGAGSASASGDSSETDLGTVGHEFAHLVTEQFSNLIYDGQSGGINEAFSDMTDIALRNYLMMRNPSPWLWNGIAPLIEADWTIGLEVSKSATVLRYMNTPTLNGRSIDNAANYVPGMDVHRSSGVFDKAFYLLSIKPTWGVDKAYAVMLEANLNYWVAGSTFNYAACGAIQAAFVKGYSYQDVIDAMRQVGVKCLVGNPLLDESRNV